MLPSVLGRVKAAKPLVVITRNKKDEGKDERKEKKEVRKEERKQVRSEATDPVQKLFVDKLREYRQRSAGKKLVDPSPAILKELNKEYDRLYKSYGGGKGEDMITFPTFKFEPPEIDPIDELSPEEKKKKMKAAEEKKKRRRENK